MTQTAVITGGSRGLGRAFAHELARGGGRVVLVARNRPDLEACAEEVRAQGGTPVVCVADVSDPADAEAIAAAAGPRIDLLINNAGLCSTERLEALSEAEVLAGLDVSLRGAVLTTRACLPAMGQGGQVLLISSTYGLLGAAGYSVYCAAKSGLVGFGDALRHELRPRGIGVHVAMPSDIDTPGFHAEVASLPDWLPLAPLRPAPLGADVAARRILRGADAGRFLVFSDSGARAIHLGNRLLPRRLRSWLIDRALPAPPGPR